MKVIVAYENSYEKGLADNLVAVLRKIGGTLIYGKIVDGGVRLEDWANKPRVDLECTTVQVAPQGGSVSGSRPTSYSAEFQYNPDGNYYAAVMNPPMMNNPYAMSRDGARGLVAMFPTITEEMIGPTKKPKRKVPKPNTTKTGVTIRAIDIEDDHEEE